MREMFTDLDSIVFELLCKSSDDYFCIINLMTGEARWSQNAVDDFDLPDVYLQHKVDQWARLIHPNDLKLYMDEIDRIHRNITDYCMAEYRICKRNGEYVRVYSRGSVLRDENGKAYAFCGITALMKESVEPNTNLPSIYEANRELEETLANPKAKGAVIYLGIDDFKRINDMYTFAGGNEVLKELAKQLERVVPPGASLYRLDGDKFSILYPYADRKAVQDLYERAERAAKKVVIQQNLGVPVELSAGVCFYPEDADTFVLIRRNVEYALETAKMQGKHQITFFSHDLLDEYLQKLRMIEALRRSVQNGFKGFELYYQPIVNVKTGKIVECEALLRWHNEEFVTATPADFIPVLEETGLITHVGNWIVTQAMKEALSWEDQSILLNVNVSYKQLKTDEFAEYVLGEIKRLHFEPSRLVLELTESCKAHDMPSLVKSMDHLRKEKVSVALDDFGTGYASLSVLRDVPTDWIKIDHNFVAQCTDNWTDRNIVRHIIMLAHALDIKVCVEGIENDSISRIANEENADTLQGYHFSRPLPAEEFEKMIKEQNGNNH